MWGCPVCGSPHDPGDTVTVGWEVYHYWVDDSLVYDSTPVVWEQCDVNYYKKYANRSGTIVEIMDDNLWNDDTTDNSWMIPVDYDDFTVPGPGVDSLIASPCTLSLYHVMLGEWYLKDTSYQIPCPDRSAPNQYGMSISCDVIHRGGTKLARQKQDTVWWHIEVPCDKQEKEIWRLK